MGQKGLTSQVGFFFRVVTGPSEEFVLADCVGSKVHKGLFDCFVCLIERVSIEVQTWDHSDANRPPMAYEFMKWRTTRTRLQYTFFTTTSAACMGACALRPRWSVARRSRMEHRRIDRPLGQT